MGIGGGDKITKCCRRQIYRLMVSSYECLLLTLQILLHSPSTGCMQRDCCSHTKTHRTGGMKRNLWHKNAMIVFHLGLFRLCLDRF